MTSGISPESIPRYAEPTWEELATDDDPKTGSCWNCEHAVAVVLEGKRYLICVSERDNGSGGDVTECGPWVEECPEWLEEL